MKISTKGRYSLEIMLDMCRHQKDMEYIPLKDISERSGISEKYLENIMKTLVKNDLLIGLRGKGGGYRLSKAPNLYTVGEILRVAEENFAPIETRMEIDRANPGKRKLLKMFQGLDAVINAYLDGISLSDLLAAEEGDMYVI